MDSPFHGLQLTKVTYAHNADMITARKEPELKGYGETGREGGGGRHAQRFSKREKEGRRTENTPKKLLPSYSTRGPLFIPNVFSLLYHGNVTFIFYAKHNVALNLSGYFHDVLLDLDKQLCSDAQLCFPGRGNGCATSCDAPCERRIGP